MNDEDVSAVVNIDGKNFRLLSLEQVFLLEADDVRWSPSAMKRFLEPLSEREKFNKEQVKAVEWQIKNHGLKFFEMSKKKTYWLDFENKKKKKYSIFFHKVEPVIFAFLLIPLSALDMEKIVSTATGMEVIGEDFFSDELKKKTKEFKEKWWSKKKKYSFH